MAFRCHTLLPLDDCLYALQATIPHLTRSSLHRGLQRHGISRLPEVDDDKPARKKFKACPIGYFHVDLAEVRSEQGKLYLLAAIDRRSKFAFVGLHEKATRRIAADFLRHLAAAVLYRIHGAHRQWRAVHRPDRGGWTPGNIREIRAKKLPILCHAFKGACANLDLEQRLPNRGVPG